MTDTDRKADDEMVREPAKGTADGRSASTREVGRVAGTEDATPLKFHVAITQDAYLQLDDVVTCSRDVPGVGSVVTSGVVTEIVSRHEGATFGSDVFLIADGVMPAQVQEIAEVTTTRVDPECYVPPRPGESAYRADGLVRDRALYFDQMDAKVPVGVGRDGEPVFVNLEFLDGTRGAHVSISGISGVATKTSFALFLLHSVFTSGVLGARAVNAKALIFSVKGEDLLFLDQPNNKLTDSQAATYARLGLTPTPFTSTGFYSPPTPGDQTGRPNVKGRTSGVNAFWWTLAEFCDRELLRYVFADVEDEKNQYTMVVHQVAARLKSDAVAAGNDGAVSIDGQILRTWPDLIDFICAKVTDDNDRHPVGRPGDRHRHRQRVHPPAPVVAEAPHADPARRPHRLAGPPDLHREPAGHRRGPARPARPGSTVRRRCRARRRDRTQGGRRSRRVAVHDARRAEQVRTPRRVFADQGGAARHRRTRPVARHHPHRRPADRQRGGAPHRVELVDQDRRPARPRRSRPPRVRVPARLPTRPRHACETGHHVHLPARDPGPARRRVPVPGLGHPPHRGHRPDVRVLHRHRPRDGSPRRGGRDPPRHANPFDLLPDLDDDDGSVAPEPPPF